MKFYPRGSREIPATTAQRPHPILYKLSCLGLGAMSFTYFRVVLINLYHPEVIYTSLGEEVLELTWMLLLFFWLHPEYRSWKRTRANEVSTV